MVYSNIGKNSITFVSSIDVSGAITATGPIAATSFVMSGEGDISAANLRGTLLTAAQPNITSVGTLTSLNVSGDISGSNVRGTLLTAAQPNVTSVGTLTSLDVSGDISGSNLRGTLLTAAQPNITSIGTLTSLNVSTDISAANVRGTLLTAAQPNVTSVGMLTSLDVSGDISASNVTGTLLTAAQPNVTSVGTLRSLNVSGDISGSNVRGTLLTAAQPNVTSVGTLTHLDISGGLTVTGSLTAPTIDVSSGIMNVGSNVSDLNLACGNGVQQINIGTGSGPTTINIGGAGDIVNVAGNLTYVNTTNLEVNDKNIILNRGANSTGQARTSGISIRDGENDNAGYIQVNALGTAFDIKAPENAYVLSTPALTGNSTVVVQDASGNMTVTGSLGVTSTTQLTGNVGVGKAPTANALDVSGTVVATSFSGNGASLTSLNASNITSGMLDVAKGGTGATSLTASKVLVGNGTSAVLQPTNLHWDNTNSRLGIGKSAPTAALDVSGTAIFGTTAGLGQVTIANGKVDGVDVSALNKRLVANKYEQEQAVGNWTTRTSAADNTWKSVCWSPELSLFCAVSSNGSGNRVMTSPDGINWTIRTSAVDNDWMSVCWAPELNMFCAVAFSGAGNRVMTSSDGFSWFARTSAADNQWTSVCWSPERRLFCAVAYSGVGNRVMTSPDGINWTARMSAADNLWQSVCWAPELSLFCAVADSGTGNRVMTSPDGITWTARTSAADNGWYSVCWSPELNMFCAVAYNGAGNQVMTSPDGVTWTARASAADNFWRCVCWSPELGLFCAVAYTGAGNRVMTSPDGINWTARTSAVDNGWMSVCWAPELNMFCAVAWSGTGNRVMTTKPILPDSKSAVIANPAHLSVNHSNGAILASGDIETNNYVSKNWNSVKLGITNGNGVTSLSYLKIATLDTSESVVNFGGIHVHGVLGGAESEHNMTVDAFIGSRKSSGGNNDVFAHGYVTGGNISTAKTNLDIAVFREADLTFSVYIKHFPGAWAKFDLLISGNYSGVTLLTPSKASTSAPTGTSLMSSLVDRLMTSGSMSMSSVGIGKLASANALDVSGTVVVDHSTAYLTGSTYIDFNYNGNKIGSIVQSGTTNVVYNTSSDQRLKTNITDAEDAGALVDAIKVRQFDWKSDGSHQRYGFVAQELIDVAPEAVTIPSDPDEMMGVDYSKLVPMLVKEIQRLRQREKTLESQMNAILSRLDAHGL